MKRDLQTYSPVFRPGSLRFPWPRPRLKPGLFVLLPALLLGGCYQNTAVVPGRYDSARSYPNVTLAQDTLQEALGFQEPEVTRTRNDLMRVTVPVRARSDETLYVEYRVIWLDEEGQPIGPEMTWAPLRLSPRVPEYVSATSSSERAENYSFQFRWSRP